MDLTQSITPRSDQKNADDFLTGPRTFTITADVEYQSAEQPFGLVLDGDTAHPYKPGKSMRRVLVAAWGKDSSVYIGRQLTLFTDPTIKFAGQDVGGIRIAAMSHIDKPLKLALTLTKGKKGAFTVEPLVAATRIKVTESTADMITVEQSKTMGELLDKLALTERAATLNYVNAIIGRKVLTRNELTRAEAANVIEALEADLLARDEARA